ncbi:Exodeoxyribonuclease VII large subunit [hydrothermal vent metagenome]|uniref:Exodeoxyribonuclease VII large subunit n=1 Tax=hydrothermal vent metagenome TaxID=652676 RepID=A0A3B0ZTG6_9ZZZZ
MNISASTTLAPPPRDIYSISRLNREARSLLEGSFPLLWIEAEISNFARPASGHWYFSLKDEAAQVRCAMFRNRNSVVDFVPKNGDQILIRARIGLYEARGEFQIIAEHMEAAGDGALRRAYDELKHRLQQQGLFATEHKQPIPDTINRIGVITSPTGAAIHDILTTLKRRYPSAKVIIYPVAVQGAQSAAQISSMIQTASARNEIDVLIIARGGGSLEDLWSFNEEVVAQAIYNCSLPIISGVGHEVDVTIADLVADFRAATPTAAAELVSPNQFELRTKLQLLRSRLIQSNKRNYKHLQQRLSWTLKRLQHPGRLLQEYAQRVDDLQTRTYQSITGQISHNKLEQALLYEKLAALHPARQISSQIQYCQTLSTRLRQSIKQQLHSKQQQFLGQTQVLNTVSPLATLERGYAIVTHTLDNEDSENSNKQTLVRDANNLNVGDRVTTRLHSGKIKCNVLEIENE